MEWRLKNIAKKSIVEKEILNEDIIVDFDIKEINRLLYRGLFISGSIGSMAVLFYYLPLELYADFFNSWKIQLNLFNTNIEIIPYPLIFNVIFLVLELYLLGLLNIFMIKKLTHITKFPNPNITDSLFHIEEVTNISLENFKSKENELGINPYHGMAKWYLILFLVFNKVKAFASNLIIKTVFRKLLGRYVLRLYMDLLGMPIYFFWNAYATRIVFLRAKYYIFGQELINQYLSDFTIKHKDNEEIKKFVYEVLAHVAIAKREFNAINYYFSHKTIENLGIEVQKNFVPENNLIDSLKRCNSEYINDLIGLFLIGIIADGDINRYEQKYLNELINTFNVKDSLVNDYENLLSEFKNGKGVHLLKSKK